MDQCSILYITTCRPDPAQLAALRALGFRVDECGDLPANETFTTYHVVLVRLGSDVSLPMLAARLRAKPRFGRRVLVALVPETMPARDRREALLSGFDDLLPDTTGARAVAATILGLLRPYPEYRCLLRAPNGRRKAA